MNRRTISYVVTGAIAVVIFGSALIIGSVQWSEASRATRRVDELRQAPVAIVFGASLLPDGTPSQALHDRVRLGAELIRHKKARFLLLSGDDGKLRRDEVSVMKRLALELGVPEKRLAIDGQGYRTYESCKRAITTFQIQEAILVTQRFHLGRAMYLCRNLGMNVQGFSADSAEYEDLWWHWGRDLLASFKAWFDIQVVAPAPPVEKK